MSILEGLAAKVAGDRAFNQNADKYVPGVVTPDAYNRGISQEDAYKLALVQQAQKANEYNKAVEMIDRQREAMDADSILRSVHTPDSQGKYKRIGSVDRFEPDAVSAGGDPVTFGIGKLQQYLLNKKVDAINSYQDSIDQGLAAKWMQSYKNR